MRNNYIKTVKTAKHFVILFMSVLFLQGCFFNVKKDTSILNDNTDSTVIDIKSEKKDKENKKIYTNKMLGFEITYDSKLNIVERDVSVEFDRNCSRFTDEQFNESMKCNVDGPFIVEIYPNSLDYYIEDYKDECFDNGVCLNHIVIDGDVIIDNKVGKKLIGNNAINLPKNYIFIENQSVNYLISANDFVEEYNEMLSSFKFLKRN